MNLPRGACDELGQKAEGDWSWGREVKHIFSTSFKALRLAPLDDLIFFSSVLPQRGSRDTQGPRNPSTKRNRAKSIANFVMKYSFRRNC